MKFDPTKWSEVNNGEVYETEKGVVRMRASDEKAALYITAQGVEALAYVGTSCEVTCKGVISFRVVAPEGTRIFVEDPAPVVTEADGIVFTNIDRKPLESGELYEVRKLLRQQELVLAQVRREAAAVTRARGELVGKTARREALKQEAKAEAVEEAVDDDAE